MFESCWSRARTTSVDQPLPQPLLDLTTTVSIMYLCRKNILSGKQKCARGQRDTVHATNICTLRFCALPMKCCCIHYQFDVQLTWHAPAAPLLQPHRAKHDHFIVELWQTHATTLKGQHAIQVQTAHASATLLTPPTDSNMFQKP